MPDPKNTGFRQQHGEDVPGQDERAAQRASAEEKAAAKNADTQAEAAKIADGMRTMESPRRGIVKVRSLHVRKDHSASAAEVGGLTEGTEVSIMDTWTDGKNTWAQVGPDQWAAMIYNGETYIELDR